MPSQDSNPRESRPHKRSPPPQPPPSGAASPLPLVLLLAPPTEATPIMVYHNPLVPRQAPPAGNLSEIIWTNPDDVPMLMPLTPEQLAALPHPNYAPRLLVTLWTMLGLATAFLALRMYCKFSRHRGAWWDDWFLVGAWVWPPLPRRNFFLTSQAIPGRHANGPRRSYASSPSPPPSRRLRGTATAATGSTGRRSPTTACACSSSSTWPAPARSRPPPGPRRASR